MLKEIWFSSIAGRYCGEDSEFGTFEFGVTYGDNVVILGADLISIYKEQKMDVAANLCILSLLLSKEWEYPPEDILRWQKDIDDYYPDHHYAELYYQDALSKINAFKALL